MYVHYLTVTLVSVSHTSCWSTNCDLYASNIFMVIRPMVLSSLVLVVCLVFESGTTRPINHFGDFDLKVAIFVP